VCADIVEDVDDGHGGDLGRKKKKSRQFRQKLATRKSGLMRWGKGGIDRGSHQEFKAMLGLNGGAASVTESSMKGDGRGGKRRPRARSWTVLRESLGGVGEVDEVQLFPTQMAMEKLVAAEPLRDAGGVSVCWLRKEKEKRGRKKWRRQEGGARGALGFA
jgi:hypothetical protein